MTQPTDPVARLGRLEQEFAAFRNGATQRVTALEQSMASGGTRIGELEAKVRPFAERLTALDAAAARITETQATIMERLGLLERAAVDISSRLDTMGRVARPGRTVIRDQLTALQEAVEDIRTRLPEEEPSGSTEP